MDLGIKEENRHNMEDLPGSGRSESASDTILRYEAVQSLTLEERRQTCDQIAQKSGLSPTSEHKILTEKLGEKKVFTECSQSIS